MRPIETKRCLMLLSWAVCCGGASVGGAAADVGAPDINIVVAGTAHQALYSIAFAGGSGVAVGASGQILESTAVGRAWHPVIPALTDAALLGVAASGTRRIAVGQLGTILTNDGGGWRKVASGTSNRLFSVSLGSDGSALAVGAFGTVLRSESAGAEWVSVAPQWSTFAKDGVEPHIYDVDVAATGTITIVGEFGLILRSSDAGRTWSSVHSGDASLLALDLRREDGVGYAVGQSSTVLRTSDHGATWSAVNSGGASILLGVRSAEDGRVFVTGMRDMLLSANDGATWKHLGGREFTADWYQGLGFEPHGTAVLIVGHAGRILEIGGAHSGVPGPPKL